MSQQIRFTETHTFESSRHSNLDFQNLQASPLPGAPLVSFDLHFDNLKDFLNNVSQTVNQHGAIIKTLVDEIRTRVSTSEMIEIFGVLGRSFNDELGESNYIKTGDDYKDSINSCADQLKILTENVVDLKRYKSVSQENFTQINDDLKQKATKIHVKDEVKKAKKKLKKEIHDKSEHLHKEITQGDLKLNDKISELEKKLAELELNTLWKIKDCEELLRVRVNEKFVHDAIRGIEERIKSEIISLTEGSLSKYDKALKDLQKDLEKNEHDSSNKIKHIKEDIKDIQDKLKKKSEQEICNKEMNDIKEILSGLNLTEFHSKFIDVNEKIDRLDEKIKEIRGRINNQNLEEEIENLKQMFDLLKDQLEKKVDASMIQDFLNRIPDKTTSEPKIHVEKSDMSEFWKFREKTLEQIRILELKLEKVAKLSEINALKKVLNSKASDEEVKSELGIRDSKLGELERGTFQNTKDIDHLSHLLKKIQSSLLEISHKSGSALVGRKTILPSNCLSCGRGDANFSPIHPQVIGRDGKLYKAEGVLKNPSTSFAEIDAYQTGAEVFSMDTHEQFHHRSVWEENESPVRVNRTSVNIVMGKDMQRSSSTLPTTIKKIRPLSAKK